MFVTFIPTLSDCRCARVVELLNIWIRNSFSESAEVLALVITYLGLLCGFFIFIGLFTRIAAIVQIPVLIVAVFFVNIRSSGENRFEFFLSLITL